MGLGQLQRVPSVGQLGQAGHRPAQICTYHVIEMAGLLATVLICDDEPSLRELIRVSLEGPYRFVEADDGEESLEVARKIRPDLVILDVMMPRRNGLDVLTELRRDGDLAETPVIVLTAQPAMREDALEHGANLVMNKPFTPDEISSAVEEVLAGRG
jgi:CheY-like chemotaxis protein